MIMETDILITMNFVSLEARGPVPDPLYTCPTLIIFCRPKFLQLQCL